MKNIFVEGIQGMGKSTLVNSLSAAMPGLQVCREGDYSPVDLAWCAWLSTGEYASVLEQFPLLREEIVRNTFHEQDHFVVTYTKIRTDVSGFYPELEKHEIYNGRKSLGELKELILTRYGKLAETGYLFECAFFQNIIEDLILFHQLTDNEIAAFYRELYDAVDPKHFLLLYLYSGDIEGCLNTISKERCDPQGNEVWYHMMLDYLMHSPYGKAHGCVGYEDLVAHFRHRQQLELRIIREVLKDSAVILPAKNWKMADVISAVG